MLTSIRNVHEEFFKQFLPSVEIPLGGNKVLSLPVRYARKSKIDRSELNDEDYPQLIILDYLPVFDEAWKQSFFREVGGFHSSDGTSKLDRAYLFSDPIRFVCRYDVTAYVKDPLHKWASHDWFFSKYAERGSFFFNKEEVKSEQYDDVVADVVMYSVNPTEVPRRDGVFEMNFEFTLNPMVAIQEPEEVELVQDLLLNINP